MTTLTRKTQKVFCGNADADQLAVFGTMKTGNPDYSSNVETLQSTAYTKGWADAILNDKAPFMEEMNAVQYGLSYQIAYMLQEGAFEYDANTNYSATSLVKVINNNELELYHSLQDDNLGNAITNTSYWQRVYFTTIGGIGIPQYTLDFTSVNPPDNCLWLDGSAVSRTTYAALFSIYGTEYGAGDGSTTFNLPDFRNRVIWGAIQSDGAGYLAAGLPNLKGWFQGAGSSSNNCDKVLFKRKGNGVDVNNQNAEPDNTYDFDASRYNSIYSDSVETVIPPSIKARYYTRYQ